MRKLTIILGVLLAVNFSLAETKIGDVWKGSGVLYSEDGHVVDNYKLSVTNTKILPESTNREVEITHSSGNNTTDNCFVTNYEKESHIKCRKLEGKSFSLNNNTSWSVLTDKKGDAYSTITIKINPNKIKLYRTRFSQGQAKLFFEEILERI